MGVVIPYGFVFEYISLLLLLLLYDGGGGGGYDMVDVGGGGGLGGCAKDGAEPYVNTVVAEGDCKSYGAVVFVVFVFVGG